MPPRNRARGEFHTPARVRIRALDSAGRTQAQTTRDMQARYHVNISQPTDSRIVAGFRKRRNQSGRTGHLRKLTDRPAIYLARIATRGWVDRHLTYKWWQRGSDGMVVSLIGLPYKFFPSMHDLCRILLR